MNEWQPIESAPKDGTEILLGWPKMRMSGYWDTFKSNDWATDRWMTSRGVYKGKHSPTHWMPLPEPPK